MKNLLKTLLLAGIVAGSSLMASDSAGSGSGSAAPQMSPATRTQRHAGTGAGSMSLAAESLESQKFMQRALTGAKRRAPVTPDELRRELSEEHAKDLEEKLRQQEAELTAQHKKELKAVEKLNLQMIDEKEDEVENVKGIVIDIDIEKQRLAERSLRLRRKLEHTVQEHTQSIEALRAENLEMEGHIVDAEQDNVALETAAEQNARLHAKLLLEQSKIADTLRATVATHEATIAAQAAQIAALQAQQARITADTHHSMYS